MSDDDVNCLVRELDVLWNGASGAAKQASLCDMLSQIDEELPALRKDAERYGRAKRFLQYGNGTLDARGTDSAAFDALIDALPKEEGK